MKNLLVVVNVFLYFRISVFLDEEMYYLVAYR
jgi:hypothetical protein